MNEKTEKTVLEKRSKELFDESVEGLDAHVRSRLNQARQKALAELERSPGIPWSRWAPAGAAALVSVFAVSLWINQPADDSGTDVSPIAALDDLGIILEEEDLEMLAELDFYLWLEDQPELDMREPDEDVG